MSMQPKRSLRAGLGALLCALAWTSLGSTVIALPSCAPSEPQSGSQTNWLRLCDTSDDCGGMECVCGTCTISCSEDSACGDAGFGACATSSSSGAIAACDGAAPETGMCLPSCAEGCPGSSKCVADVCVPQVDATVELTIDVSTQLQTLVGFGASLSYEEGLIVNHPDSAAVLDAMFQGTGFDVIRLRNNFDGTNPGDMDTTAAILSEASARMGRSPILLLSSGSPPAALKANGDRYCSDADVSCTLAQASAGGFDYAGFAEYWRASLEAYKTAGVVPDYVSIQSNVDYLPPDSTAVEACRFLPQEGSISLTNPDGSSVDASFPGYQEALSAVQSAVQSVGDYAFVAPEAGSVVMTQPYTDALDALPFAALAAHMYGTDPQQVNVSDLEALQSLGQQLDKPILQTEMSSEGFDTALLAQYALTSAGASAYLQQRFIEPGATSATTGLIRVDGTNITPMPSFYALWHFAYATDPGWIRVQESSDTPDLLASAWLSPDGTRLTVIITNAAAEAHNVHLDLPEEQQSLLGQAQVTRTVFAASERGATLGALPSDQIVRVPPRSVVTITTDP